VNRPFILGLAGAAIVGAAIGLTYFSDTEPGKETAAVLRSPDSAAGGPVQGGPRSAAEVAVATPQMPDPVTPRKPTFDVVRVNPQGDAVIAGRAMPNAAIVVRDGAIEVGAATADARGEWVVIPKQPLPSGSRELTLSARLRDGTAIQSDQNIVVMVPARTAPQDTGGKTGALAVLVPRVGKAGSTVIQTPNQSGAPAPVSIDAVDYDTAGNVTISGKAATKVPLSIYIDNRHAASGASDSKGRWRVVPGDALAPGTHTLRVDHLGSDGKVIGRAETQFTRAKSANAVPDDAVVMVEPGNSLWRIARRVYGSGVQYSVIFDANRGQIRDPDLIYPGQVFFVPHVN